MTELKILKVRNGYTLVEVLEEGKAEIRKSGLVIPETAMHRIDAVRGRVVSVSDQPFVNAAGRKSWPEAKEGDIVLYSFFRGKPLRLDGKDYRLLEPEEVLGVLEP
mgnify:CR=1 FL=1